MRDEIWQGQVIGLLASVTTIETWAPIDNIDSHQLAFSTPREKTPCCSSWMQFGFYFGYFNIGVQLWCSSTHLDLDYGRPRLPWWSPPSWCTPSTWVLIVHRSAMDTPDASVGYAHARTASWICWPPSDVWWLWTLARCSSSVLQSFGKSLPVLVALVAWTRSQLQPCPWHPWYTLILVNSA